MTQLNICKFGSHGLIHTRTRIICICSLFSIMLAFAFPQLVFGIGTKATRYTCGKWKAGDVLTISTWNTTTKKWDLQNTINFVKGTAVRCATQIANGSGLATIPNPKKPKCVLFQHATKRIGLGGNVGRNGCCVQRATTSQASMFSHADFLVSGSAVGDGIISITFPVVGTIQFTPAPGDNPNTTIIGLLDGLDVVDINGEFGAVSIVDDPNAGGDMILDVNAVSGVDLTQISLPGVSVNSTDSGQTIQLLGAPNCPDCVTDCNGNGIFDDVDIDLDTSPDVNMNGIPDECDAALSGTIVPAVSNFGLVLLVLMTAVAGVIVIRRARRGHAAA